VSNDNLENPCDESKNEINDLWSVQTETWTYTEKEIKQFYSEIYQEKWLIAGQPHTNGNWKCLNYCDTENHHLYQWCNVCQKRTDLEMNHLSECKFGFGLGQVRPDMDPNHLVNEVFWDEPREVQRRNKNSFRYFTYCTIDYCMEMANAMERIKNSPPEEYESDEEFISQSLATKNSQKNRTNGRHFKRFPSY
jgi:hypothetical protein